MASEEDLTRSINTSLRTVFSTWRDRIMREIKVSLPGYITEYDAETRLAKIQLTIKPELNGEFANPPLLNQVPIRQNNSPSVCYYTPPETGALVDVMFTDFSLAEYQEEDGLKIIQPQDLQKHGINNPYAVLRPETAKNKHRIDDPTLPGIYLREDSKLFLGRLGGGGEEVLNLMHQTAKALGDLINYIQTQITFTHAPGSPSGPPTNATLIDPVAQKLAEIQTDLTSLGDIAEV